MLLSDFTQIVTNLRLYCTILRFFPKTLFFRFMTYSTRTNSIHVIRACFALWLEERGILLLERACLALWLKERGIITFGARLFCFMALRTKNITFAARIAIAKQRKLKRILKWKQSSKNRGILKRNSRMEIILESELNHGSQLLFYYSTI